MKNFAHLLDRLILTPSRNGKLRLLSDYFRNTPDPDRGYALAAITRDLEIVSVKPAMLRGLVAERFDEVLFRLSYDYVGDLAETIALIWDPTDQNAKQKDDLSLGDIVEKLQRLSKADALRQMENWLNALDQSARYALLKLVTGGMRIGVSVRLAKQSLADLGNVDVTEIEELWHGLSPPYTEMFAWLVNGADKPIHKAAAPFRPVMLAHPIADEDFAKLNPEDFVAEWKWDGIRVQASSENGVRRLYSRTGDDISHAFPDLHPQRYPLYLH